MSKPRNERKIAKKHFNDIAAVAGESFSDYLIIARTYDNGLQWRASNGSWAEGAAGKFLSAQRNFGTDKD